MNIQDKPQDFLNSWGKYDDSRMPTEMERQHLARLMYYAFCELRLLGREGRNEQATALADVFHNVPLLMYANVFSLTAFLNSLACYQHDYEGQGTMNYLQEWKKLSANTPAQ